MSYATLSSAITARLTPFVGRVQTVTPYEIQSPESGYPYIAVIEDDTAEDERAFDTITNIANYRFKVRIVHNARDLATTNATMRGLVDDILKALRTDLTFGCEVLSTTVSVRWGYSNEENVRVADISLNFSLLADI